MKNYHRRYRVEVTMPTQAIDVWATSEHDAIHKAALMIGVAGMRYYSSFTVTAHERWKASPAIGKAS